MPTDLPHFDWPIRFVTGPDDTISYALVEQDTPREREASAAVIACTPRGHRDDDPTFGVTSPLFTQGPIDAARYASELNEADPRLDAEAEETLDLNDAMVRKLNANVDGAT